jgi:hypothetical protein
MKLACVMIAFRLFLATIATLCIAMLAPAGAARANDECSFVPPALQNEVAVWGWSACRLKDWDEAPIWKQYEKKDAARVTRLMFDDGRTQGVRFIRVIEKKDGRGTLVMRDTGPEDYGYRGKVVERANLIKRLSVEEVREFNRLADASGTFDHVSGSWDDEEIFIHCDVLEMERIDGAGYRYSSVNISCNQPERLMPFVREVTRLAGIKPRHGGLSYVD